ncbi:hypothetical protein B0H17DRAFT_1199321 [Mycena rosella]|uniref:Uncharacterized protein n=1 Tax=Mycena rosella TaxID=1033263 RepID=A0AAD7GL17_MYCRO|nr:hypothetical protein B0H17DRAFT_1199321 [Mycena rosella]
MPLDRRRFWEHLGNGDFVRLEDNPRLEDLNAIAATWDYCVFCYDFQPLLNTRRLRCRRADRAPRSSGKGKARARTESESESDDEQRPSSTRMPPRNPASPPLPEYTPVVTLEDFSMDVDPVSPPPLPSNIAGPSSGPGFSAGASSSRAPPPTPAPGPSSAPRNMNGAFRPQFLGMPFEAFADPRNFSVDSMEWDTEALLAYYDVNPLANRVEAHKYMESVLSAVGEELRRREASSGKGKGKGKAPEGRPSNCQ